MAISLHADDTADIPPEAPLKAPAGFAATCKDGTVHFYWDTAEETRAHYRIHCGTRSGRYERIYPATGRRLRVTEFAPGQPFDAGRRYYARIEAICANGRRSVPTGEISFTIHPSTGPDKPHIPLGLQVRVLWSNVRALIHDILL
jgi:hypothetical protein